MYPRVRLINCIRSLQRCLGKDVILIPVHVNDNVEVGVLSTISSVTSFMAAAGKIRKVSLHRGRRYLVTSDTASFTTTIVHLRTSGGLRIELTARTLGHLHRLCGPRRVLREELTICSRVLRGGAGW